MAAIACVKLAIHFIDSEPDDAHKPTPEAATPHSSQPPAGDSLYEPI